jgi:AcrR family transcriptional regulator
LSITVEHAKRKREVLEKALDVFVDEGYEDTTFQKIAERCGITRTILYLYFKNKREIFAFSIKLFTEKLEAEIKLIGTDLARTQAEKLDAVISMVVDNCARNRRLLSVILDYLGHIRASGGAPDERVRRRTIRMRHILSGLIIEGQKSGEFGRFSVKAAGDLLYAVIEAAIFRLTILGREEAGELVTAASLLTAGFKAPKAAEPAEPAARAVEPKAKAARAPAESRSGTGKSTGSGGTRRSRR